MKETVSLFSAALVLLAGGVFGFAVALMMKRWRVVPVLLGLIVGAAGGWFLHVRFQLLASQHSRSTAQVLFVFGDVEAGQPLVHASLSQAELPAEYVTPDLVNPLNADAFVGARAAVKLADGDAVQRALVCGEVRRSP